MTSKLRAVALLAAALPLAAPGMTAVSVPFVGNAGQLDPRVAYLARTPEAIVHVTRAGEVVSAFPARGDTPPWAIVESFVGAPRLAARGAERAPTRVHDLRGDPARHRAGLPTWRAVDLGRPWPGVSVRLLAGGDGVEKVFELRPGTPAASIQVAVRGIEAMAVDAAGALELRAGGRAWRLTPPVAWQERDGLREPVEVAYRIAGPNRYGFTLGPRDERLPVHIDPLLQSTYAGGSAAGNPGDAVLAVAVAPNGEIYAAGRAQSTVFPGTAGNAQPASAGSPDGVIARYNATLTTLLDATYLGTAAADVVTALAVGPDGFVYAAGSTEGGLNGETNAGGLDAFVVRLPAALGSFSWTQQLGSNAEDAALAIAVSDPPGTGDEKVFVAGYTYGILPTAAGPVGSPKLFVAKYHYSNGLRNWVKDRGATATRALAVAADAASNVFLAGTTTASSFGAAPQGTGAFAISFDASGVERWKTLIDGAGNEEGLAIALDANGKVAVAGSTTGALDGQSALGAGDAFVVRFTDNGTSVTRDFTRLVGGTGADAAAAVVAAPAGLFVGGSSGSSSIATATALAIQPANAGGSDGFVAWVDAAGTLRRTTFLGGTGADAITGMAWAAAAGELVVGGTTASTNFPGTAGGAMASRPSDAGSFLSRLTPNLAADGTAPDTTLLSGPSGTVASQGAQFTFSSSENPSTFECRLDGAAFGSCASGVAYAGLASGLHTFDVRAIDASDNVDTTPATRAWTIDVTPPDTIITSMPPATTLLRTASFSFAFAVPEAGSFQCSLDGGAFAACTSPRQYMGLATGAHAFAVRAIDSLGNADATPASFAWTVLSGRGDSDGDGKSELYWQDGAGGLSWWRMDGTALLAANYFEVAAEWVVKLAGDFDGDGKADLVWRREGGVADGATYLWRLDGMAPVGFHDLGILPLAAWDLAGAGDLDGDGRDDLVWRNKADGTVYVWLMNGGAVAGQGAAGVAGSEWAIRAVRDLDGDGRADIVFRRATDGAVYAWLMNGTAIAGAGGPGALDPAQWSLSGAGDFDGDRRADLLWRNDVTGETWVWLMSGPAIVHAASLGNPGTAWAPKVIADLTGDGRADIVLRQGTAATYLWVMSGAAIAAQGAIPNPGGTWQLAAP
jgi:hypothetical protein